MRAVHVLAGIKHSSRDFDLPACFWVSLSDDPVTARNALAEKLAYYGPSISAPMLATAGLQPQDFAAAARLAHGGQAAAELIDDRMLSLGVAGDAADVMARCRVLLSRSARGTCRSGRRSALTRWPRSACSATRYCRVGELAQGPSMTVHDAGR